MAETSDSTVVVSTSWSPTLLSIACSVSLCSLKQNISMNRCFTYFVWLLVIVVSQNKYEQIYTKKETQKRKKETYTVRFSRLVNFFKCYNHH